MTRKQQSKNIKDCIKALNPSIVRVKLLDMVELSKTTTINPLYNNVFLFTSYNVCAYASENSILAVNEMKSLGNSFYIIKLSNNIYVTISASCLIENTINFYKAYRNNPLITEIAKYEIELIDDVEYFKYNKII